MLRDALRAQKNEFTFMRTDGNSCESARFWSPLSQVCVIFFFLSCYSSTGSYCMTTFDEVALAQNIIRVLEIPPWGMVYRWHYTEKLSLVICSLNNPRFQFQGF